MVNPIRPKKSRRSILNFSLRLRVKSVCHRLLWSAPLKDRAASFRPNSISQTCNPYSQSAI